LLVKLRAWWTFSSFNNRLYGRFRDGLRSADDVMEYPQCALYAHPLQTRVEDNSSSGNQLEALTGERKAQNSIRIGYKGKGCDTARLKLYYNVARLAPDGAHAERGVSQGKHAKSRFPGPRRAPKNWPIMTTQMR